MWDHLLQAPQWGLPRIAESWDVTVSFAKFCVASSGICSQPPHLPWCWTRSCIFSTFQSKHFLPRVLLASGWFLMRILVFTEGCILKHCKLTLNWSMAKSFQSRKIYHCWVERGKEFFLQSSLVIWLSGLFILKQVFPHCIDKLTQTKSLVFF